MIPSGVLQLEDGTFEVWCDTQDGPERCGVCKTLEKARLKWFKAQRSQRGGSQVRNICIHRSDLQPNHAPFYRVESETIVLKRAVRVR
jgi:hypothetical protein